MARLLPKVTFAGGGGPPLKVGRSTFPMPPGVETRRVGELLAYVYDRTHGDLYAYVEAGQVNVPKELGTALAKKYFPTKQDS